ncbi:MAG: hypothetical protein AAF657_09400 [Acidobacteriota bacterium]
MNDNVLGDLIELHDAAGDLEGYTATVASSQGPLELQILLYGTPLSETLPLARDFATRIDAHLDAARSHLISSFLPMHNAGYLEDGVRPVSEDAFLAKAGTPLASIDLDGEISFTYGHEDLLWGHWMGISIHPDGSVDTDISG